MITSLPIGVFGFGRAGFFLLTLPLDPREKGHLSFIDDANDAVTGVAWPLPWPLGVPGKNENGAFAVGITAFGGAADAVAAASA
jgi:hypothetical protein